MSWLTSFLYKLAAAKLNENSAAQGVHGLIGFVATYVPHVYGVPLYITVPVMSGAAALIEFWFDAKYEKQSFKNNLIDFLVYNLGEAVGIILSLS